MAGVQSGMAIARFPVVAIDCPDPGDLARFCGAILDWPVDVDDLDEAEAAVALGAVKHDHQPGTSFRVFLDPAGHPFCLCTD